MLPVWATLFGCADGLLRKSDQLGCETWQTSATRGWKKKFLILGKYSIVVVRAAFACGKEVYDLRKMQLRLVNGFTN